MVNHSWKAYASGIALVEGEGSLGRFKNVAKQLGIDLSSKLWQDLKDTEEVRNCLLHANGRISLLKDPRKIVQIERLIEKKNSELKIKNDCIEISSKYLQSFNENVVKILDIMNKENAQQS